MRQAAAFAMSHASNTARYYATTGLLLTLLDCTVVNEKQKTFTRSRAVPHNAPYSLMELNQIY